MAYYPSHSNPFTIVLQAPASPVPSHQSSSQSGTTSPGGSSSSITDYFGDFSTSTGPSPSTASWAAPSPPNAYSYSEGAPPSPSSSHGTRTGGVITVVASSPGGDISYSDEEAEDFNKTHKDTAREHGARARACSLLEATAETALPEDINKFKTKIDTARERESRARACSLLEATAETALPDCINKYKTDIDIARERGAKNRAIALLEATAGSEVSAVAKATSCPKLTMSQAAAIKYDERQRCKVQIKAKLREDKEKVAKPIPTLVVPKGKEALAESSRKPKTMTAEDLRDPETVAGMKCEMDIEREKRAEKKALFLLQCGCMV